MEIATALVVLWTATQVRVIDGFNVPESVLVDPDGRFVYVSNVETSSGQYWAEDGKGFISRLTTDGKMDALRWRDSTRECPLNSPKGLCILDGELYVADINRVVKFSLTKDEPGKAIAIPEAKALNDMASDGKAAYVSDTGTGKIYRLGDKGDEAIKAPKSVNGITFAGGKLLAVSWDLHEVYEVDAAGRDDPKPFGIASHFKNLDGIEALDDGTLMVSDNTGGKICAISPDRKTVATLAQLDSPADIGLDRKAGLLYVPQFHQNKVVVYKLRKSGQPAEQKSAR